MTCHLSVPLAADGEIVLQDRNGAMDLPQLAELLGLKVVPGVAAAPEVVLTDAPTESRGVVIHSAQNRGFRLCLEPDSDAFETAISSRLLASPISKMRFWHYAVVCAGIAAVLRKRPVSIVHGAMLMLDDGRAAILMGESGIGKSTTARRWRDRGHDSPADDMILMEYDRNGEFFAHAMPTWSRCMEHPERPERPTLSAAAAVPVAGVVALGRGAGKECVNAIPPEVFFGQLMRSVFYHLRGIAKYLPEEKLCTFNRQAADFAGRLAGVFPPRGLFAALDDDIEVALEIIGR